MMMSVVGLGQLKLVTKLKLDKLTLKALASFGQCFLFLCKYFAQQIELQLNYKH